MKPYYEANAVDWDQEKVLAQIIHLENWDILSDSKVIGAIRLAFDDDGCYLRDLQVSQEYQNKGIGAEALGEAKRLAKKAGVSEIRLRVLKISPAYNLYRRKGFEVSSDDERFYYMEKTIT